jgi:hypothetical protein
MDVLILLLIFYLVGVVLLIIDSTGRRYMGLVVLLECFLWPLVLLTVFDWMWRIIKGDR